MTTGNGLAGARVLVTGASAGIGRAAAIAAVRQGARVVLAARRQKELEAAAAEAGGGQAIVVDLTEPLDCERLGSTVEASLGGLDVVISSAGVAPLQMMTDTSDEHWEQERLGFWALSRYDDVVAGHLNVDVSTWWRTSPSGCRSTSSAS